mmetsp:Transcript_17592/g.54541  ORF Transcript_17592/g.54541 Transcript_17592/m.54541 type:complete len:225 (-) Transcript_17592:16-690(-)
MARSCHDDGRRRATARRGDDGRRHARAGSALRRRRTAPRVPGRGRRLATVLLLLPHADDQRTPGRRCFRARWCCWVALSRLTGRWSCREKQKKDRMRFLTLCRDTNTRLPETSGQWSAGFVPIGLTLSLEYRRRNPHMVYPPLAPILDLAIHPTHSVLADGGRTPPRGRRLGGRTGLRFAWRRLLENRHQISSIRALVTRARLDFPRDAGRVIFLLCLKREWDQ